MGERRQLLSSSLLLSLANASLFRICSSDCLYTLSVHPHLWSCLKTSQGRTLPLACTTNLRKPALQGTRFPGTIPLKGDPVRMLTGLFSRSLKSCFTKASSSSWDNSKLVRFISPRPCGTKRNTLTCPTLKLEASSTTRANSPALGFRDRKLISHCIPARPHFLRDSNKTW